MGMVVSVSQCQGLNWKAQRLGVTQHGAGREVVGWDYLKFPSFSCLTVDAGCWLGPSLGLLLEHFYVVSPLSWAFLNSITGQWKSPSTGSEEACDLMVTCYRTGYLIYLSLSSLI